MSRDLFGRTFRTVRLDPPWPEDGGGKRGAQHHYETIKTLDDLIRVVRSCPYFDRIAADAHCYMDCTNRFLVAGAYGDENGPAWGPALMRAMGFRPITVLTWAKMERERRGAHVGEPVGMVEIYRRAQPGIGQYFRGETEQVIFGVRGDGMRLRREHTERRDIGTLIPAPVPCDAAGRRIHSRKPPESYALIEAASPGPYLEIFARLKHGDAWTPWGLDAPEAG